MSHKSLRESLDSENYIKLRQKLIILRKTSYLTQRDLSKKLSVSQSYVSKVELGQRRLDFFELKKYLETLNYSIPELYKYINETKYV